MDWVRSIPGEQWAMLGLALSVPVLLTLITLIVTGRERTATMMGILLIVAIVLGALAARG